MSIKFSVIIPIYNVEAYLVECLESVVNQSSPFDEVILVNDGSQDGSSLICREYVAKHDNFILIEQSNKGQATARNLGIEISSGDYIMFLDSDDWLASDCAERMREILSKEKLDALYFDADIVFEMGQNQNKGNFYDRNSVIWNYEVMSGMQYFCQSYPKHYIVMPCLACYKSSIIKDNKILFPEGIYYEDNYFSFVFLQEAQTVMHIPENLYVRRYRQNSTMTSQYSERKFTDYICCVVQLWEKIRWNLMIQKLEQKQLLLQFINEHCSIVLKNYLLCMEENIVLSPSAKKEMGNFVEKYSLLLTLYASDKCKLDKTNNLLILRNLYYLLNWWGNALIPWSINFLDIKNELRQLYFNILKTVPFQDSSKKVGVYGTGKHTEGLLQAYEELVGMIQCELIFIDSTKNDFSYKGRTGINYKMLDESFDFIVISSFYFEDDMLEKAKEKSPQAQILTFYHELQADIFSK